MGKQTEKLVPGGSGLLPAAPWGEPSIPSPLLSLPAEPERAESGLGRGSRSGVGSCRESTPYPGEAATGKLELGVRLKLMSGFAHPGRSSCRQHAHPGSAPTPCTPPTPSPFPSWGGRGGWVSGLLWGLCACTVRYTVLCYKRVSKHQFLSRNISTYIEALVV